MRLMFLTAVGASLMLTGCEDNEAEPTARPITVRSEVQDQLHELSELNLKIAMRRAIYDAGASCPRVDEAGYIQEYGNLSLWTASCSNNQAWAVFVAPDGTAQLRRCEHMEELNLPRCEIRERPWEQREGKAEAEAPVNAS